MTDLQAATIYAVTVMTAPIAGYFGVIAGEKWCDRRDAKRRTGRTAP